MQVAHARAAADAARQEVKQSHAAIKPLLVALGTSFSTPILMTETFLACLLI